MYLIKKVVGILLYMSINCLAFSQAEQKQLFFKDPRAGSFTIFGDIPVSYTTGIPDISIPLFTMESHGFKIPVILKYHLALVKPPYDYTNVATGWVLDVGGSITQEFKSQDDFKELQPANLPANLSANTIDQAERDYLNYVALKQYDTEHDIFSYSFAGKDGKFIVERTPTLGQLDIKPLTTSNLKGTANLTVWYPNSPELYEFQNIQIRDEQGYKYFFRDKESRASFYSHSYFLNEIKTPNDIPIYNFEYMNAGGTGTSFTLQNIQVSDNESYSYYYVQTCGNPGNLNGSYSESISPTPIRYEPVKTVKKVTFENGTLEFTFAAGNRHINGMVLKDKNGNALKTVTFEIGNFPGQGYRYLNRIFIKDNAQNTVETYTLNYNSSNISVSNNSLAVDFWGYLCDNAQSQPWGFVPMETFSFEAINNYINYPSGTINSSSTYTLTRGDGSRQPSFWHANLYTLNSITYPTGGRSEFTYGLNQSTVPGGGLRVEKVTNYSEGNIVSGQKRYEYDPGDRDFSPTPTYHTTTNLYDIMQATCSEIISYHRQRYYPYSQMPATSDNRVRYKHVTEYWENGTTDIGKTVYDYAYFHQNINEPSDDNYYIRLQQDHIENGVITKKRVYKKNGAAYDLQLEEVYDYSSSEMWRSKNLFLNKANVITSNSGQNGLPWDLFDFYGSFCGAPGFYPFYYDIVSGTNRLTKKTVNEYTGNGIIKKVYDYHYDDGLEKYITRETMTTGDGGTKTTRYKYPYSPEYASSFPYNQMIAINQIAEPIKITSESTKNGVTTQLSTIENVYGSFGTNIFRPQTVKAILGGGMPEPRFHYNYESSFGNLVSTYKENGIKKTYLWGYNKSYAVAEIIGADYATASSYIDQSILDNPPDDATMRTQLNNLRSIPNTMVTTYMYKPLIGMTSVTDISGRTTYYEYDGFGRLAVIRNQDGNVVKRICYNYSGQAENCAYYLNTELNLSIQKNDCPSGTTGGFVTYTVPANKYGSAISQADANAKAQAEIDTYGQVYANANATCTINSGCFRCTGASKKCINNWCETGIKVYTDSYYDAPNNQTVCIYHYEWSDGSWSIDYSETYPGGGTPCIIQ